MWYGELHSFLYLGQSLQVTMYLQTNDSTAPNKQHRVGDTASSNLPKCSHCLRDLALVFLWVADPPPPEPSSLNRTSRGSKRKAPLHYSLLSNRCFPKCTGSYFFLVQQAAVSAWKFPDTGCVCACVEVGVRATGAE